MRFGFFCILLALLGAGAYHFRDQLFLSAPVAELVPDPERYAVLTQELSLLREDLALDYRNASGTHERDAILSSTRTTLETILPEMMLCWLGTPWDFNGTSETPGEGQIACGYFVSTILRDAGFNVPRIKLAQQPSQNILHTFVDPDTTTLIVGKSYDTFLADLKTRPGGIYIVGLDTHVGFILNQPDQPDNPIRFIHSSGAWPEKQVVNESAEDASVLQRSNYRIYGNVTTDEGTLHRWLVGSSFAVASR